MSKVVLPAGGDVVLLCISKPTLRLLRSFVAAAVFVQFGCQFVKGRVPVGGLYSLPSSNRRLRSGPVSADVVRSAAAATVREAVGTVSRTVLQ